MLPSFMDFMNIVKSEGLKNDCSCKYSKIVLFGYNAFAITASFVWDISRLELKVIYKIHGTPDGSFDQFWAKKNRPNCSGRLSISSN